MQLSILDAQYALTKIADSWLNLQLNANTGDNSNNYLRLADNVHHNPNSDLLVLCVHDGQPARELHALCVLERHRNWIASRNQLANWISQRGLNSTPLLIEEQRFSALDTIIRELPSHDVSQSIVFRHLHPQDPTVTALQAICAQRKLELEISEERSGSMRELKIPLKSSVSNTIAVFDTQHDIARRGLR